MAVCIWARLKREVVHMGERGMTGAGEIKQRQDGERRGEERTNIFAFALYPMNEL